MTDASALGIYALDVGQGDCTFVVPPAGHGDPILIDCNDSYVAERFVANHGFRRLEAVVVTHLDRDHIRGIVPFLKTYFDGGGQVGSLYIQRDRPVPADGDGREIALLLEQALDWDENPPCVDFCLEPVIRTRKPKLIARGKDWVAELILPFYRTQLVAVSNASDHPNACSAVVRVARGGKAVLICGDALLESWNHLEPDLDPAAAIRTPHHGGDLGHGERLQTANELYDAVGADHALVSVGTNNRWNHPTPSNLEAMRRGGACRVRCTQLTPTCHSDPLQLRELALEYAGGVEWTYRHRGRPGDPRRPAPTMEAPCAGSMVCWIDAHGTVAVEPQPGGAHDRLLYKVSRPRCQPLDDEP
jgi:beta-lactamase superfamily II metal-dependent hydrolase